jgi:hypothetical protein
MIHLESKQTVRVVETHHTEVLIPNSAGQYRNKRSLICMSHCQRYIGSVRMNLWVLLRRWLGDSVRVYNGLSRMLTVAEHEFVRGKR